MLIRDWVKSHGRRTAYLYSTENRQGIGAVGVHTHLLIHVPPSLDKRFQQLLREWAKQANLVMRTPNKVLNPHRIGNGNATLQAVAGKLRYMGKDLELAGLELFAPFKRLNGEPQIHDSGKPSTHGILGKKVGVSRNIDQAARLKWRPAPAQPTLWMSSDGRKPKIVAGGDDRHRLTEIIGLDAAQGAVKSNGASLATPRPRIVETRSAGLGSSIADVPSVGSFRSISKVRR